MHFSYIDTVINGRKKSSGVKNKAARDAYQKIGVGYNIKQRKRPIKRKKSEKSRKKKSESKWRKNDFKWKKKSLGSDTSRSRPRKKIKGKVSRSGIRKKLSKSKYSEKNFSGSHHSALYNANKNDKNS